MGVRARLTRPRRYTFAHDELLFGARLDAITTTATQITLDFCAFVQDGPATPCEVAAVPHERAHGDLVPYRLTFHHAQWLTRESPALVPEAFEKDALERVLLGIAHVAEPQLGEAFILVSASGQYGSLALRARGYQLERREGQPQRVEQVRRWARTPAPAAGLLPRRYVTYARYGGDGIGVVLGGRLHRRRLFVGGIVDQFPVRPTVDTVLNLCELGARWNASGGTTLHDRHACKGEMDIGMDVADLLAEAEWVTERLRAGKRVLVHCFAGVNRSVTVCCAALMLLEGLSPSEALARVRERRPQAFPDPYHWFALHQLAERQAPALVARLAAPLRA